MAFKSLATVLFTLAAVFAEVKETESGLKVEYISKPDTCDKVARNGDMLSMHYVGTLESGAKFDSSYDRSEPFKFQIGVGQVIKGWEEGVLGMCVGEKRKLIVPPALGYGDQGAGDIIPGGATLYFEVELIEILVCPKELIQGNRWLTILPYTCVYQVTSSTRGLHL